MYLDIHAGHGELVLLEMLPGNLQVVAAQVGRGTDRLRLLPEVLRCCRVLDRPLDPDVPGEVFLGG